MIFDRGSLLRLMITAMISVAIYTLFTTVYSRSSVTVTLLLASVGVGAVIWLVSEAAFEMVSTKWPHNIVPSYIVLALIIAIGTGLGSWLLGVDSFAVVLFVCACAEVGGLGIALVYRIIYKRQLNDRLRAFKKKQG